MNILDRFLLLNHESASDFRQSFGKKTFLFEHGLGDSPLMQLSALRVLCEYTLKTGGKYHFETGNGTIGGGFGPSPRQMTLVEAFDRLNQGTLILLKSIQAHPGYGKLVSDFLEEFSAAIGANFTSHYKRPYCTIILASPKRVTPYHIDGEENLLMQVRGDKRFCVFDGNDRRILTARDLEYFWGARQETAQYNNEIQQKAIEYRLTPGTGVHVPVTFPHWAQNGDEISIAVSINFQRLTCVQSNVSRANYKLRKLGIPPCELGKSPIVDMLKSMAFEKASAFRRAMVKTPA
jgi:hypothetical protein